MTDHAKTLAEALRDLIDAISHSDFGYEDFIIEAKIKGDKTLAAYDAHPAEAATSENGDLATALRCAEEVRYECQFAPMPFPGAWARARLNKIIDFLRALSTHQQQGDGPSHIEAYDEKDCFGFSRAPQPDTVTEEMVNVAVRAFWDSDPLHHKSDHDPMRAALTAALAARGKA